MSEDEIYIACVCGELVKKEAINQHVEDCLKDELVKNCVSLKISKSRGEGDLPPKERHVCAKCMRCGYPMTKDGSLIAFYPSVKKSSVTCCSYMPQNCKESVCKMCKFPKVCHQNASESQTVHCIDDLVGDLVSNGQVLNGSDKELKCRERKAMMSQFLECVSENKQDLEGESQHEHSILRAEIPAGPPCKQFHVAVIPNYNSVDCDEDSKYQIYSLLLQILNSSPSSVSVGTQTDPPTTVDAFVQVKFIGDYSEEVEILFAENKGYSVPEYDPNAEAAFRSHLSTLIPCSHCNRTFSPDRIQKHISCCIERPKSKDCKTPADREIKR